MVECYVCGFKWELRDDDLVCDLHSVVLCPSCNSEFDAFTGDVIKSTRLIN